jgi:tetratricopeptide (TPR) repeat protein
LTLAYQANPTDATLGVALAVDLEAVGYAFSAEQMGTQALNSYKEASAIMTKLRQLHPENHELDEAFAGTELALGKLLRDQGEAKDARDAFEQCSQILFRLQETGQLDDQGVSWLHEADMQLRQPF